MNISRDAQAILLLCASFGNINNQESKSLTTREWNIFARKIHEIGKSPGDLLEFQRDDFKELLLLPENEIERFYFLLQRSGSLAIGLEKWESLGIHVMTRADDDFPQHYRVKLKDAAPPVLFYAGERELLGQPGIAVVGSRNLDETGEECAQFIGNTCGISGLVLYSGGAKGVDQISMKAALSARGTSVGILADNLERTIRVPEYREAISQGNLCLASNYSPSAAFSIGRAMGRNKLIYALADYAIVVASGSEKGGTWAGATEALRAKWLPIFILEYPNMPEGNKQLLDLGANKFPFPFTEEPRNLNAWLENHSKPISSGPQQPDLFKLI
jgi:predicted Rossmann fold nucleotide-binding protein DprA/Smf involved in DNA uptake